MYILEGNIGAGKSTFLKLIKNYVPEIDVALEPVHNWQKKVYGQSLLANFYQDPHRWAYTLETFAMICRVIEHLKDQVVPYRQRIIERSIYSGHYCFTLNGYKNGFMNDIEWSLYNQWFNYLIPQKCMPPHGFIYLRTDPDVSYKRIKKRNRLAEKKITFSYLQQIHKHHEDFLIKKDGILPELKKVPVLTLDCNEEFEKNPSTFFVHVKNILEFITCTTPLSDYSSPTIHQEFNMHFK
jgi:deoxyadenosine/deoxycytidine kinase